MGKDWKFYTDELKSEECFCNKNKKRGMSFCYACYKRLPKDLQQALYQHISDGYEEAYEEAVEHLTA